jgi:hypothetical protein
LEELLTHISTSTCFDTATNNALTTEWTEEEVLAWASKAPFHSNPGVDGISYELLQLLLQHPFCIRLFTKVLNTTLHFSFFLTSSLDFPLPEPNLHSLLSSPLPDGTPIEQISTKWFHHIEKALPTSLPSHYPQASKASWTQFWHVSIPHQERTILWRLYLSKLPTRSRLHKIMCNFITNESCMLCGARESNEHFL